MSVGLDTDSDASFKLLHQVAVHLLRSQVDCILCVWEVGVCDIYSDDIFKLF
jgi:hypothetical protein